MIETHTRASITEEAIRKVKEKTHARCPKCSQVEPGNWGADVAGIWISPLPVDKVTVPPPMIPALTLTCQNCGYVSLHNLKVLGVERK